MVKRPCTLPACNQTRPSLFTVSGANPYTTNKYGSLPSSRIAKSHHSSCRSNPSYDATNALFEQAPDAEKAAFLVKARLSLAIAAGTSTTAAMAYLQRRMLRVERMDAHDEDCVVGTFVAFLLGMGVGPGGRGMPRKAFLVVLDMLMPTWGPLRGTSTVGQQQGEKGERNGGMEAVVREQFWRLSEAKMRQWGERHPHLVNDKDELGMTTPLYIAVNVEESLPLTLFLLDEKGADVNAWSRDGKTPLHVTHKLPILNALLERGADVTLKDGAGMTPLHDMLIDQKDITLLSRLLQDRRV